MKKPPVARYLRRTAVFIIRQNRYEGFLLFPVGVRLGGFGAGFSLVVAGFFTGFFGAGFAPVDVGLD